MKNTTSSRPALRFSLAVFFLTALVLFLPGCGGGGTVAVPPPSPSVWINSPTGSDIYQTDRDTIVLKGSSFVPAGSSCPAIVGVMPPGYSVTWANSANGSTGRANFYLGCLLEVNVIWETYGIPLVPGANPITVTASDSAGSIAHHTLSVIRVADATPPAVVSVSPPAGSTGIAVGTSVVARFSKTMDAATINPATIILEDSAGNLISAEVNYDTMSATLQATSLEYSTTYQVTVTTEVRDAAGNALTDPYVFSFTTEADPDATPPPAFCP